MNKTEEINLTLLELNYQRYLSRAHTIFEVCVSLIPTVLIGIAGFFFALLQLNIVLLNKFYIIKFSVPTILICVVIFGFMIRVIFNSRRHRIRIENCIKKIRDSDLKPP